MEEPLILDRYRPLAELGEGGHGSVVLAYDTRMARRVAIKRLPLPTDGRGRPLHPAGLAEARTAALLNHPAIVTVHEWDTDRDEAFIIMEDVSGTSVADLLDERGGPLDVDETAAVVEAVASALIFAHANGVLHLDVKPENVLIARDGRVKVADFGISVLTEAGGHAESWAGTFGYMPLEQLAGRRVDGRADEWALAVLAYECLAFANPFSADTLEGAVFKAEVVQPPPPSEFEPSVPEDADAVLLTALAPFPDDRYASVAEFAERLLEVLGDPAEGRRALAVAVTELLEEEEAPAAPAGVGLWDRLRPYERPLRGVAAAAIAGWLAWAGLGAFSFGPTPTWVAVGLVAAAAALAPALGLALALLALVAGAATVGWLPALVVLVGAAAYWAAFGRMGSGTALVPTAAPWLGALGAAPTAPLVAGFVAPPLEAAAVSGMSCALVALVSAASGASSPFLSVSPSFLVDPWTAGVSAGGLRILASGPGALIAVAAWAGAGAAMSVLCRRASRPAALAGLALASVIVSCGYLAWSFVSPTLAWADPEVLRQMGLSLILGVLLVGAGPPTRPEEE